MKRSSTKKYCIDRRHIRALEREGIGWGYDLDSGCFLMEAKQTHRSAIQKIKEIFK